MDLSPPSSEVLTDRTPMRERKFSREDWLNARLRQYHISSTLDQFESEIEFNSSSDGMLIEEMKASVSLQEATAERELKENAVLFSQLNAALTEVFFPPDSTNDQNPDVQEIKKVVSRIMELEKDLLHIYTELEPLEAEVLQVKKENRELMESNRAAMTDLKSRQSKVNSNNSAKYNELRENDDIVLQKLDLVQNSFQALLLGCEVRWAEDNKLQSLVESLGKSLDTNEDVID